MISQVCWDLVLTETPVRPWLQLADIGAGQRLELTTSDREELTRPGREVRVLQEE